MSLTYRWVTGLGPNATGGPVGVCAPPVVGLIGVVDSPGRINDGERHGPAVLSRVSGGNGPWAFNAAHLCGECRQKLRHFWPCSQSLCVTHGSQPYRLLVATSGSSIGL